MRTFVTGATGYLGSAVVEAFLESGHEVTGLARTARRDDQLRAREVRVLRGDLREPSSFERALGGFDVLIHAGFAHGPGGVEADRAAILALLAGARATGAPRLVIYTSCAIVLGDTGGRPADENASTAQPPEVMRWRPAHEQLVLEGGSEIVATAVIRPGFVYGGTAGGIVEQYFASAEQDGSATFIGPGENRWSLVHRDDAARLYLRVAAARARGIFHAVDGAAVRVADVARTASEAAGRGGAVKSLPLDVARRDMGAFADALGLDQTVVARRSAELGWRPVHPPVLECAGAAFREWRR